MKPAIALSPKRREEAERLSRGYVRYIWQETPKWIFIFWENRQEDSTMLYYTPGVTHRSPLPLQSYLPEDPPMQRDPMVQLSADLSAVTINEPGANPRLGIFMPFGSFGVSHHSQRQLRHLLASLQAIVELLPVEPLPFEAT
ncbi:hypothetical protein FRX31_020325 [Thalictrum thalictroides]|uniref:Uncharacterized protein n=1 Tax=Thalictrum thalictroides TaxID=46969 RepID=A0A7J6VZZ5_THATH|nr:hypothetical protein FRX31_020325 [Thalictrum thalictroides]